MRLKRASKSSNVTLIRPEEENHCAVQVDIVWGGSSAKFWRARRHSSQSHHTHPRGTLKNHSKSPATNQPSTRSVGDAKSGFPKHTCGFCLSSTGGIMALKISLSRTRDSCHPSPLDPTPPLPPASFPTYLRYLVARLPVAVAPASYALTMSDRMSMMSKCRDQSLAESPASCPSPQPPLLRQRD